jgi:uroporphyrinogen-III synthase
MARQSTSDPVPVLLTRSLAQSRTFAAAMMARFGERVRPVIAPLLEVEYLRPDLPDGPFAAVIFTSANGVAATEGPGRLPPLAWCVGDRTAEAARAAGFRARSAGGDADALVAALSADPPGGRLLHLRGEDTRGAVAERLTAAGVPTEALILYRQVARPMSAAGRAALAAAGPMIVPVFSPESARRLVAEISVPPRATLRLVAMSRAVADAAEGLGAALWVARQPDAEAMLEAVGKALVGSAPP